MSRTRWQERIVVEPDIHHGVPCVKGTRVPVAIILGSLADGMDAGSIIAEYPQLTGDDIAAALSYAAEVMQQDIVLPMSA
jgi:uncharacterized protein (DUF433 family)